MVNPSTAHLRVVCYVARPALSSLGSALVLRLSSVKEARRSKQAQPHTRDLPADSEELQARTPRRLLAHSITGNQLSSAPCVCVSVGLHPGLSLRVVPVRGCRVPSFDIDHPHSAPQSTQRVNDNDIRTRSLLLCSSPSSVSCCLLKLCSAERSSHGHSSFLIAHCGLAAEGEHSRQAGGGCIAALRCVLVWMPRW